MVQDTLEPVFPKAVPLLYVGGVPAMYSLSVYDVHRTRAARESCRLGSAFFFLDAHVLPRDRYLRGHDVFRLRGHAPSIKCPIC